MKLDELAKLAGVSRTTVSYVVNGKAKEYRVSDKTIQKVQALIEQYKFKPNVMAAGLRAGKSDTIGLIIPDFENVSYAKIANDLEKRCREKGYQLLIGCSNDNPHNERECAKHFFQRKIDALIVSTALPNDTDFYRENSTIPIIGFDRQIDGEDVVNVLTDDKGDAFRLTDALLQQKNYRSILFFGALPELPISGEREGGFCEALKERSISAEFLYAEHFRKESAAQAFEQWLEKNAMPEALFTTSLTLLQGVLKVLLKQKKAIPSKLDIATFGAHEMIDLLPNRVICSAQNHEKVVSALLDLVLYKLKNKKHKPLTEIITRDLIYHNCHD